MILSFSSAGALFALFAPLALLWPSLAWRNKLSLVAGRLWSRFEGRLERVEQLEIRCVVQLQESFEMLKTM